MKKIATILLVVCLFTSCVSYKVGMEQAKYAPIVNMLPPLQYTYTYSNVVVGNAQFIDNIVNSELSTNVIQKVTDKPVGVIHVECTKFHLKNSIALPFLSGLTLFTWNLLGMPFMSGKADIALSISIKTLDGNLIKNYNYTRSGRSVGGFYYGKDISVKTIELCRDMMSDFKRDISNDYKVIVTSLDDAQKNGGSKGIDYNLLAETIAQKTGNNGKKGTLLNNQPSIRNSDIDTDIPVSKTRADNTFVLIIANENYEFVDDVQFALNDGEAMREYCVKTLGVPERQVWFYKNASAGIIAGGVDKMVQAMDIFDDAKAIVYYCGHGIPDEKTGDAYLVPTDGKGTNVATCYSLNKLYKTLAKSKASSVTYFMDACFTGSNRDGSMLVAARGVAREAKKETIEGNTVVFSAASGDETAMPYKEKQHGLFTYFLLKKIQETKGEVSYGELADYIKSNVRKEAFLTNEKPQNPVIATSERNQNTWKSVKLK